MINACPGTTAQFTYLVESVPDISRQWRRNGVALIDGIMPGGSVTTGANAETLTIANAQPSDGGSYDCVITSPIGLCTNATSEAATLSVRDGDPATPCTPAPSFTLQPIPASILESQSATFQVTALTTCVGRYQWEWRDAAAGMWVPLQAGFNGVAGTVPPVGSGLPLDSTGGVIVSGEQTDVLTVQTLNLRPGTGTSIAEFRCVVSDDCATVLSNAATLTITPRPTPTPPDTSGFGVCCNPFTEDCTPTTSGCPAGFIFSPSPATCATVSCRPATRISCCYADQCVLTTAASCQSGGGRIVVACGSASPCPLGMCCNPNTGASTLSDAIGNCPAGFVFSAMGVSAGGVLNPCPQPGGSTTTTSLLPLAGACCRGSTCAVTYSGTLCTNEGGRFVSGAACNLPGNTLTPCCLGDFNQSGGDPTPQDIYDFLAAFFGAEPRADINQSGSVTVQDIFDFLAAYFAGC